MAATPPPPVPSVADMKVIRAVNEKDLGWLPPNPQKKNVYYEKMKENPLVPIGCAATVGALLFGLLNFKRGNVAKSQLAMRMRVLAQTGTIVALAGGVMWQNSKQKEQSVKKS